jgi:sugar/nucleoside kinase (ribokinase family)
MSSLLNDRFDVLGLGYTAVDELLYVESYPPADSKMRVLRSERHCGGLTATALVAASRLGARCAYAGVLGNDELSNFVSGRLREEGIGLDCLRRQEAARPVHSVIVVDEARHTRTIFYDLEGVTGVGTDWPPEDVLRATRVLFVDHLGLAGTVRAARVADSAGIPVVADFESIPQAAEFADLVAVASHPIVSEEFAAKWTGCADPAKAALALWSSHRQAVVVTCGAAGCWYLGADRPDEARHQPAYRVEVVDTTGCGDVFHGAYAAGLAQGLDLAARIRLAAATAALKATRRGGQDGIPDRAAVEAFLR